MASDLFSIEVVGDRNLLRNFEQMPEVAKGIIADKVKALGETLTEKVRENILVRLNQHKNEKDYSGSPEHLSDAVQLTVTENGQRVEASISVVSPYARIQEQGGIIPPHFIFPRDSKVLAFMAATGQKVVVRWVLHPGAVIKGTYYMRDAYREMSPYMGKQLQKAVVDGIRAHMRMGT